MSGHRVIVVGVGPIGLGCAQAVVADRALELVGLVDVDPAKVGRTLDELSGRDNAQEGSPVVTADLDEPLRGGADVAVVTTSSRFDKVAPTVQRLVSESVAVVSSCEQMAWPWYRHRELADVIDAAARRSGCAVLGTGVNPGFVMDSLAVTVASMLRRVTSVRCVRRVDAGMRRSPLQVKVGATLSKQQFGELADQGRIGHQGLGESVVLLAAGLGERVEPGTVCESLEPCLADRAIHSALGLIAPGEVTGIHNVARWRSRDLMIELDLTMAVGLTDPKDIVHLDGPVSLSVTIPGSIPGDSATVAALINHIPIICEAQPGIRTMLDLPSAGCRGRDERG